MGKTLMVTCVLALALPAFGQGLPPLDPQPIALSPGVYGGALVFPGIGPMCFETAPDSDGVDRGNEVIVNGEKDRPYTRMRYGPFKNWYSRSAEGGGREVIRFYKDGYWCITVFNEDTGPFGTDTSAGTWWPGPGQ